MCEHVPDDCGFLLPHVQRACAYYTSDAAGVVSSSEQLCFSNFQPEWMMTRTGH